MTEKKSIVFCLILCAILSNVNCKLKNFKTLTEWRDIEFAFPSEFQKEGDTRSGRYLPGNAFPIDVDVDYNVKGTRVFVTMPRFNTGVPITLGVISSTQKTMVQPYPNYMMQASHGTNCDHITSVVRVFIDKCKRMWVLDTGKIGEDRYCAPQLLIFDLTTDQLVHRYRFPSNVFKMDTSLFVTPIVDVYDETPYGCKKTKVYIADVTAFAIVVYDLETNDSWRIQNRLMYPSPKYGIFNIASDSFDLMDGVLGMAISKKSKLSYHDDRILYFHSLASTTENMVSLNLINNSTIWKDNVEAEPRAFEELGSRGTQSAAQAMDTHGNLFFGLMNPISIACWDTSTPYNVNNIHIVAANDETLQFASGVKVIVNLEGQEELWILSCRLQRIMAGTKDSNEINFRIMALSIRDLLEGDKCRGISSAGFTFPNA